MDVLLSTEITGLEKGRIVSTQFVSKTDTLGLSAHMYIICTVSFASVDEDVEPLIGNALQRYKNVYTYS